MATGQQQVGTGATGQQQAGTGATGGMKIPVPQIAPYLESEGLPAMPFKQWILVFDATLELIQLNQPQMSDKSKNLLLFTHLGARGGKILASSPVYAEIGARPHQEFRKSVAELFLPRQSPVKALHDFHQRTQRSSELVDNYVTDLQSLLADCTLPQNDQPSRNFFLMVQLVEGCYDLKTKQDLLAMANPSLEKVLQHMRAQETAKAEATAIGSSRPTTGANLYKTGTKCDGCGSPYHQKDRTCPAWGKRCNNCQKPGHFASVCRSPKPKDFKHTKGKQVKTLNSVQAEIPIMVQVTISPEKQGKGKGQLYELEADTGSSVSTLTVSTVERFFGRQVISSSTGLQPVRNYDGSTITGIVGIFKAVVTLGANSHMDIFHVMEDCHPEVLGKNFLGPLKASIDCSALTVKKTGPALPYLAYPKLLSEELGTFKGGQHRIQLKPGTVPKAVNPRPIPLCHRDAALQEIKLMDEQGIWQQVLHSEWAHPMVTVGKPEPGKVRITTDLTRLNDAVIPERFPIPRIKDLFLEMRGAQVFSKLDLRKGYYHILLHEDSRALTTTATPLGLRMYCHLPMGLKDSASVFQRFVSQALADLPGVVVYIDDIIVFGKDQATHDHNLNRALQRLEENDFRLQPFKCLFSQPEIPAFGHIISKDGVRPDPKNVQPIIGFPEPTCVKEVQSFLGLVNFFGEYITGLGEISEPLRKLTRQGTEFIWDEHCTRALRILKEKVQNAMPLYIFNPQDPTIITTDAADSAIGAILTQITGGKEVPIACFNRTLNTSERNYSATEKEAYAVILALEHWEKLVLGRPVLIRTDHQALLSMLKQPKDRRQSSKFCRWLERLEPFQFTLEYVKGGDNKIADMLSRMPPQVKYLNLSQILDACSQEEVFKQVKELLEKGWPKGKKISPVLQPFKSVFADLKVTGGLLKLQKRIFLPERLRLQALQELHQGHPGIERLKRSLRKTYWWPGLSKDTETFVKNCTGCCYSDKSRPGKDIPVGTFPVPKAPGELYNLDITGPFYNGHYLVVLIDAMSNFPEILDTKDITSSKVIKWLKQVFSRTGLPVGIITDNGPQFISDEFKSYLASLDVHHYLTPVYYPQENGRVEVFNRTLKHGIQAATAEGISWEEGVERILMSYRHTPAEDNRTPAEKFLARPVRRPGMVNEKQPYRRIHRLGKVRGHFRVGDLVLVRQSHVPKGLSPYTGPPEEVKEVLSYFTVRLSNGKVYNARRLKLFKRKPIAYYPDLEPEVQQPQEQGKPSLPPPRGSPREQAPPLPPRKSTRQNFGVPPQRYRDLAF